MSKPFKQTLERLSRRCVIWSVIVCFCLNMIAPQLAYAQMVLLPQPGLMVQTSAVFTPAIITGMRIDTADPLNVDFLIDTGDDRLAGEAFRTESQKLINYFFAALTVPEDQMWVNLSPYEKDRIIAQPLSQTAMGRDMLAQDYLLKQLSASMLYPEDELGKKFWDRVYRKAQSQFGTTDIPLNTFNKIWIVPERAKVFVNDNHVFVSDSHLKVMLEEDYLALEHHSAMDAPAATDETIRTGVNSDIVREVLIPEIEREINEGKNFAPLRQMFHSLILAAWYKKNLKESVLGRIYVDQNKISGVDLAEKDIKEKIYNQYIAAFKRGVFDYIKEDIDAVSHETIPRRYFSGGVDMAQLSEKKLETGLTDALQKAAATREFKTVSTYAGLQSADQAIFVNEDDLEFHIEAARKIASEDPAKNIKVFFRSELLAQFPHDTAFNIILTLVAGKLRNKTKDQFGQFNMYSMANEVHIEVVYGGQKLFPTGGDSALLSSAKKKSLLNGILKMIDRITIADETYKPDIFKSGEFLNARGQTVSADVITLWEHDPDEPAADADVDSIREIQQHLAGELKTVPLFRADSTAQPAEQAPQLTVIKRQFTGFYLELPDAVGNDLLKRVGLAELVHMRLSNLLAAISLNIDHSDQAMMSTEDRLEIRVPAWGKVPEREENERETERRASIEIRQQLGILYGELEQIIAQRREASTPEQYQAVELREQMLVNQLRNLYSDMPVKIHSGESYEFYSQALKELKDNRRKLSRMIELADIRKNKAELSRLNLDSIRNKRLLIKVQILVAGMLLTGNSRDGIRHPVPALNALEGAINSANALEIELEYRIQRLRGQQLRKSFETNDWLGNRVRTYRLGTFDIDVDEKDGQDEPTVLVRQKRPINVHTRLDQIRLQANRGEIAQALEKIDELTGLYSLHYLVTLERYKNITQDLKDLKDVISRLTPGQKLEAGEIKDDIKSRVESLTANIHFPKQMVWSDVPYRGLRKAFDGQVKKIASELAQYMVVLKNKTDLTYYAKKLKEADQRKERGRKTPLSQHNREVMIEKLRELQQWTGRGFVVPKIFATIDLAPVITLIEADDFKRAEAHLQGVIAQLDKRLKDIDRIAAHLKVSATSLFLEFRDDDITQRIEGIGLLIKEGEYISARDLLTELNQEYFDLAHVEPGLIRAAKRIQTSIRLLSAETPDAAAARQLTRVVALIKEDIRHKTKFKINITNERKEARVYFVEPGTTVQGLLNIGKRDPKRVSVKVDGKKIGRTYLDRTRLLDEARVIIHADQAMEADTTTDNDDGFLRAFLRTDPVSPIFVQEPGDYLPGRRLYGDPMVRKRVQEHLRGYLEIALRHGKRPAGNARQMLDNFLSRESLNQLTLREIEEVGYDYIKELANVREPMSNYKTKALDIALEFLPQLQAYVEQSRGGYERGLRAVELALKGNITSSTEFRRRILEGDPRSLEEYIQSYLNEDILYHQRDTSRLVAELMEKEPKNVVYLFDNIIEYIYDLPLILFILKGGHSVTLVGKAVEADNDVTADDIKTLLYLDEVKQYFGKHATSGQIRVISSGSKTRGTDLRRATPDFVRAWDKADIIISKGEGNRGTLLTPAGLTKDVYFITFSKAQYEVEDIPIGLGAVEFVSADGAMLGDYTRYLGRLLHVNPSFVAFALGDTLDLKRLLDNWDEFVKKKGISPELDEQMVLMMVEALNRFGRPYDSNNLIQFFAQRSNRLRQHLTISPRAGTTTIWLNAPVDSLELDYPNGFFATLIYLIGNSIDWGRFIDLIETAAGPMDPQLRNMIYNKELALPFNLFNANPSRPYTKRYFNSFAELTDFYRADEASEVALLWGSRLLIEDVFGDANEIIFDRFNDGMKPTAIHAVGGHFFDASIIRRIVVLEEPLLDEAMVGTADQRRSARRTLQRKILAAGGDDRVFGWIKNETNDKATELFIRDGDFSIVIDRTNERINVTPADQAMLSRIDKDREYSARELHANIEAIEQMLMVLSPNHKDIDYNGITGFYDIGHPPKPIRMFSLWLSDNSRRYTPIEPKLIYEILAALSRDFDVQTYTLKNKEEVTQAFLGFPKDKLPTQQVELDFIKEVFMWLVNRQAMLQAMSVKIVADPLRPEVIQTEIKPAASGMAKRLYMLPDDFYQAYKSKMHPFTSIDIRRANTEEMTNLALLQIIPHQDGYEFLVRTQDGQEISITDAARIYAPDFAMLGEDDSRPPDMAGDKFKSEKLFISDIRHQRENRSGLDTALKDLVTPAGRDVLLAATQFLEIFGHKEGGKLFDGIAARKELAENPAVAAVLNRYLTDKNLEAEVLAEIGKTKTLWLRLLFELGFKNIKSTSIDSVLRQEDDPVAVVFDGESLTKDPQVKAVVFTYKAGYFYAITQIVDHEDGKGDLAEGGLRYKIPQERTKHGKFVVSDRAAFEIFKDAYTETDLISRSKYYRNTITQTPYAGAKTVLVVHPDAVNIKSRHLKGFATAMVDAGLASRYVIGTESGMTAKDQNTLSEAINQRYLQHLQYELEMIKSKVGENLSSLTTTEYGGLLADLEQGTVRGKFLQEPLIDVLRQRVVALAPLGRQNGGTSLVKLFNSKLKDDLARTIGAATTGLLTKEDDISLKEWSLAAYSTAMSVEAIIDYLKLEKHGTKIGIKGATTGGSLALMLTRLGYKVVAIEDIHGTVYNPEGFSTVELQRLESININQRNVTKWLPEENGVQHLSNGAILDKDQVDLDIFISAAPGRTVNPNNIAKMRGNNDQPGRQPLIYLEAGFNSFEGFEKQLAEKGILALKSTSIGFGGAYGSWLEDFIKHRFTSEQLQRYILRTEKSDIVAESNPVINEQVDLTGESASGQLIIENGRVVGSNIPDLVVGMSVDINTGRVHSHGIDLNYRVTNLQRTVIWGNYLVVQNQDNVIVKSNHPGLPAGLPVRFINPLDEIQETAYNDIAGIAFRMNTMVLELVRRGFTPAQAARKIADLISAKKERLEHSKDTYIIQVISDVIDHLNREGYFFPPYLARKIAIKRLVVASDLGITLDGKHYIFNALGRLEEQNESETEDGYGNIRFESAKRGTYDISIGQAVAAEKAHDRQVRQGAPSIFQRHQLPSLYSRIGIADDQMPEAEQTAGTIEEQGLGKAAASKKRETNPEAVRYIHDQREQKMNRSGLDQAIPDVAAARRDILLGTTQFLEILSHYESKQGKGPVFDSIEARKELVAHPDIARAMIGFVYQDVKEKEIRGMLERAETRWLTVLFERGIKLIKQTNADINMREKNEAIALRFDGVKMTGIEIKKEIIFIYLPDRFYAITQLVDISKADHTKGGIRYAEPVARANDPLKRNVDEVAFDIMKGAYNDLNNLSVSQYSKNVLAGIGYAGAKTYFGVSQDALPLKDTLLKAWATAMVDVGLMEVYDGGPDVGMSSANQETIIAGIIKRYTDHLKNEIELLRAHGVDLYSLTLAQYGRALKEIEVENGSLFLKDSLMERMRERLILALPNGRENGLFIPEKVFTGQLADEIQKIIGSAVTGGSARVGAISHVDLAVTGHSTLSSIQAIINYKGLDPSKLKVAVIGAGDVGGSIALKLAREGYIVVAISDINGTVYKPEGFTLEELQNLNNVQPGDRNVLQWMPERIGVEHLAGTDILNKEIVDIDLLVPAAMGGVINDKTIDLLRGKGDVAGRDPLIIIEGSNNAFVGMEAKLAAKGILAVSGMSVNFGGVKGSTKEAMLKHLLTVRELREITLKKTDGSVIRTSTRTQVNETIEILNEDGTQKLGTLVINNGNVVKSDIKGITIGANLDPDEGRIYNRGDDLGYRSGAVQRAVTWSNFLVRLDENGKVTASNHPDIKTGETVEFVDPMDAIKKELYAEIEAIATRNNIMVMELTSLGMNPTEAVVKLANALGIRKAEIYEASEGPDADRREIIVHKFKQDGYFMVDHIARNIASIQLASEGELSVEAAGKVVTFDADGRIKDHAMMGEIARATISQSADFYESVIVPVMTAVQKSYQQDYSFRKTNKAGKIDRVIIYTENPDKLKTDSEAQNHFNRSVRFAEVFTVHFNTRNSKTPLKVTTETLPLFERDEEGRWSESVQTVVSLQHVNATGLKFYLNSDFYLRGLAKLIFNAFMKELGIGDDQSMLAENLQDLERNVVSTAAAFKEESNGRKNRVSPVLIAAELDYLFTNMIDNKDKDIQRRAAQLYRFGAMTTQRSASLNGDPFREFLHHWMTVLQPNERLFRRYLKNLARGELFHFLIQTNDPERPRAITGQDIADQQEAGDSPEFVRLADAFINLIQLRKNLNQAALIDLANKLLNVPPYYPDSAMQAEDRDSVHFVYGNHLTMARHRDKIRDSVQAADIIVLEEIDEGSALSREYQNVADQNGMTADQLLQSFKTPDPLFKSPRTILKAIENSGKIIAGSRAPQAGWKEQLLGLNRELVQSVRNLTGDPDAAIEHFKETIQSIADLHYRRDMALTEQIRDLHIQYPGKKIAVIRGASHTLPVFHLEHATRSYLDQEGKEILFDPGVTLMRKYYYERAGILDHSKISETDILAALAYTVWEVSLTEEQIVQLNLAMVHEVFKKINNRALIRDLGESLRFAGISNNFEQPNDAPVVNQTFYIWLKANHLVSPVELNLLFADQAMTADKVLLEYLNGATPDVLSEQEELYKPATQAKISAELREKGISVSFNSMAEFLGTTVTVQIGYEGHDVDFVPSHLTIRHKSFATVGDLADALKKTVRSDEAMTSKDLGGVDFNTKNMRLEETGEHIRFENGLMPMIPAQINGIQPVIINITPVTNLYLLLGLNTPDETPADAVSKPVPQKTPSSADYPMEKITRQKLSSASARDLAFIR
ncbi:MAG: ARMT1-like domain-containing protein [Candidatus Omnitrophota bacterium]